MSQRKSKKSSPRNLRHDIATGIKGIPRIILVVPDAVAKGAYKFYEATSNKTKKGVDKVANVISGDNKLLSLPYQTANGIRFVFLDTAKGLKSVADEAIVSLKRVGGPSRRSSKSKPRRRSTGSSKRKSNRSSKSVKRRRTR